MSETDDLENFVSQLRQLQLTGDEDELIKAEGELAEAAKKIEITAGLPMEQVLSLFILRLMKVQISQLRANEANHLFVLELLLKQAKEMTTLKDIVMSFASEKTELKHDIDKVRKDWKKRDRLLAELQKIVDERRRYYRNHK
jgi:hypothetical protein